MSLFMCKNGHLLKTSRLAGGTCSKCRTNLRRRTNEYKVLDTVNKIEKAK